MTRIFSILNIFNIRKTSRRGGWLRSDAQLLCFLLILDMTSRRVKLPNNKKIPLFTLGSIYSNDASGAEQMPDTNKI